jgi:hypothetical protein
MLLGLIMVLLGCASKPESRAWSSSMGNWFTNDALSADDPPRAFWTRKDEEQLLRRMGYADAAALGTLRLVSQYSPSDDLPGSLSLAFRPDETLFGTLGTELDSEGELTLSLDPSSTEFRHAVKMQHNLTGARYLLFLKRGSDNGALYWACYRATPRLLDDVRTRYLWVNRHRSSAP